MKDEENHKCKKLIGDITHGYSWVDVDEVEYDKMYKSAMKYLRDLHARHAVSNNKKGELIMDKWTITNVIFNNPATIVFWDDGTKTVVKCGEHDIYDPEKGLAMAIVKKVTGNESAPFHRIFKKYLPKEDQTIKTNAVDISKALTVKEYCEKYQVSKSSIYRKINNGDLNAYKNEKGKWMIGLKGE